MVICKGTSLQCPDRNTCCKLKSGHWGCCPLPSAKCCANGVNCCPHDYTCSPTRCVKGDIHLPLYTKTPAIPIVIDGGIGENDEGLLSRPLEMMMIDELGSMIKCRDGRACPTKSTCCIMTSGKFGCCPFVQAQCCKDGVHCCPKTYVCDDQKAQCRKGMESIPWFAKIEAMEPVYEVHEMSFEFGGIVCPDRQSQCPSGSTCCKSKYSGYTCCPVPRAVCCNDGLHCCRHGYTCDLKRLMCVKTVSNGLETNAPLIPKHASVRTIICPDDVTVCPNLSTCCKATDEQYACCPLPKAVCCSDKIHCCAEGYTCDLAHQTCDNGVYKVPLMKKVPGLRLGDSTNEFGGELRFSENGKAKSGANEEKVEQSGAKEEQSGAKQERIESITCPDHESQCADGQTCCMTPQGVYACCPLPKATCCNDGLHCCPQGYTCNLKRATCNRAQYYPFLPHTTNLLRKRPAIRHLPATVQLIRNTPSLKAVICPDKQSQCPEGNTCCTLSTGGYGCCPMPKAVGCKDHVHCCPNGYTCDVAGGSCIKGSEQFPLFKKIASTPILSTSIKVEDNAAMALFAEPEVEAVICPDKRSQCPEGNTCCALSTGGYGCCPMPKAVCCKDHVHCCPNGYTCDVAGGSCNKGDEQFPLFKKIASTPILSTSVKVEDNAAMALFAKPEVEAVICPDKQSQCPDGNTCCALTTGGYGCCPLPKAVCCKDHVHCCPNGYTCDVAGGSCNKGDEQFPLFNKIASTPILSTSIKVEDNAAMVLFAEPDVEVAICPDKQSQCPEGNTCCALSTGSYGCCPMPKAVCCKDHVHCCPNGYTCDVAGGSCNKGDEQFPLFKKIASTPILSTSIKVEDNAAIALFAEPEVEAVICPDKQSQCPEGNTCCTLSTGGYGCCPLPKAVCCKDHVHCCPNGYTCDVAGGSCNKGSEQFPLFKKIASTPVLSTSANVEDNAAMALLANPEVEAVICPDKQSQCPEGNTCCSLTTGGYGCCPLPKAVCCKDHVHCCPNGYTCDVAGGSCNKGDEQFPLFQKIASTKVEATPENIAHVSVFAKPQVGAIICPDKQSQCPDGNTCCSLSTGGFGCCPMPKAVCCKDHVHCCPNGYTCDVAGGSCNKGDEQFPLFQKVPSTKIALKNAALVLIAENTKTNPLQAVICPDHQSQCPDGSTCCATSSGQYACCPLPMATCCKDHIHCCPNGYTCDVAAGTCQQGLIRIPFVKKTKTESRPLVLENGVGDDGVGLDVVCPDKIASCPDTTTCCMMSDGHYGCCPLKNAVCCEDHLHCCPENNKCDIETGTCLQGTISIPWQRKIAAKSSVAKENSPVAMETGEKSVVAVTESPCPGGGTCPGVDTCCPMGGGYYGCCSYENATCCPDKKHCCPHGTICVNKGAALKCQPAAPQLISNFINRLRPMTQPELMKPRPVIAKPRPFMEETRPMEAWRPVIGQNKVTCPDGRSWCNDWETCCAIGQGTYGCCPYAKGVCCSDHVHCCPGGYNCTNSQCVKQGSLGGARPLGLPRRANALDEGAPPVVRELFVGAIDCGKGVTCPEGTTCCDMVTGEPGCCPVPHATCCQDKLHCCGSGLKCDKSGTKCTNGTLTMQALRKFPARQSQNTFP